MHIWIQNTICAMNEYIPGSCYRAPLYIYFQLTQSTFTFNCLLLLLFFSLISPADCVYCHCHFHSVMNMSWKWMNIEILKRKRTEYAENASFFLWNVKLCGRSINSIDIVYNSVSVKGNKIARVPKIAFIQKITCLTHFHFVNTFEVACLQWAWGNG